MAGPITWRNVASPNDGGNRLLANATNAIGQSTNGLFQVLAQIDRTNDQNAATVKNNNTQNYLDQVAQAALDPTKLADPATQAALTAQRQSFGPAGIDQAAARAAIPQAIQQAQTSALNTQKYNDVQTEVSQRPLLDKLYAAIDSGDTQTRDNILNNNQLLDERAARTYGRTVEDDKVRMGYAAEDQARQGRNEQRSIQQQALSNQATLQNIAFGKENHEMQVDQFNMSKEDRQTRNENTAIKTADNYLDKVQRSVQADYDSKAASNPFTNVSKDPIKDVNELMKKSDFSSWFGGDQGDISAGQKELTKLMVEGVPVKDQYQTYQVKVTPDILRSALDAMKGNWNIAKQGKAGDVGAYISDMLQNDPSFRDQAIASVKNREILQDQIKQTAAQRAMLKPSVFKDGSAIMKSITTRGAAVAPNVKLLPDSEDDEGNQQ